MPEHLAYKTAKRKSGPIEFSIDGDDYVFTPPKTASMMLPVIEQDDTDDMGLMALKVQYDWIEAGLPEEQAERIKSRLKNPKDDFDSSDLENISKWIMKQINGRPTG